MKYDLYYYSKKTGRMLECRQTKQDTYEEVRLEAELYSTWCAFHYKCDVTYEIRLGKQ